jgi:hypothetical protein
LEEDDKEIHLCEDGLWPIKHKWQIQPMMWYEKPDIVSPQIPLGDIVTHGQLELSNRGKQVILRQGIPQGTNLSSILSSYLLNQCVPGKGLKLSMYADDGVAFITNKNDFYE